MSLVRLVARPMMAAIFVIQGAKNLRDPDPLVPTADELTAAVLPDLKARLPRALADRIPEDSRTWVRVHAVSHVAGGLLLASGRFSRVGALLLATSMLPTTWAGHPFWKQDDPGQRIHFLKNISIAGGMLLAAVDTDGKPGLWWRTKRGCSDATKASKRAARDAAGEVRAFAGRVSPRRG